MSKSCVVVLSTINFVDSLANEFEAFSNSIYGSSSHNLRASQECLPSVSQEVAHFPNGILILLLQLHSLGNCLFSALHTFWHH